MNNYKATIFNIQKYNTYDGNGIRTLVFFKGCPLRCLWCSNPEGQSKGLQILFKKEQCSHCGECVTICPHGVHELHQEFGHIVAHSERCTACGACAQACYRKVFAIIGEEKSIEDLYSIIEEDKIFYDTSGGGVTLGGGEVLIQSQAATALLKLCTQRGINTAIETCGYTSFATIQEVSQWVDTFLYDIKHMDSQKHYEITGVHNEKILNNLQWLLENKKSVKIRFPLLKGINDSEENLQALVTFLLPYKKHMNYLGIDILPYHKFGIGKYAQLGLSYTVDDSVKASEDDIQRVKTFLNAYGLYASVLRH